jgi:hypothetical protein
VFDDQHNQVGLIVLQVFIFVVQKVAWRIWIYLEQEEFVQH